MEFHKKINRFLITCRMICNRWWGYDDAKLQIVPLLVVMQMISPLAKSHSSLSSPSAHLTLTFSMDLQDTASQKCIFQNVFSHSSLSPPSTDLTFEFQHGTQQASQARHGRTLLWQKHVCIPGYFFHAIPRGLSLPLVCHQKKKCKKHMF